jgi:hypothetical protein
MNFAFSKQTQKANPEQAQRVKDWMYQVLEIDEEIPISLSQLQCTEPGCPPIETVIAVMKNPVEQYKLHKSIAEIQYTDIAELIKKIE